MRVEAPSPTVTFRAETPRIQIRRHRHLRRIGGCGRIVIGHDHIGRRRQICHGGGCRRARPIGVAGGDGNGADGRKRRRLDIEGVGRGAVGQLAAAAQQHPRWVGHGRRISLRAAAQRPCGGDRRSADGRGQFGRSCRRRVVVIIVIVVIIVVIVIVVVIIVVVIVIVIAAARKCCRNGGDDGGHGDGGRAKCRTRGCHPGFDG